MAFNATLCSIFYTLDFCHFSLSLVHVHIIIILTMSYWTTLVEVQRYLQLPKTCQELDENLMKEVPVFKIACLEGQFGSGPCLVGQYCQECGLVPVYNKIPLIVGRLGSGTRLVGQEYGLVSVCSGFQ